MRQNIIHHLSNIKDFLVRNMRAPRFRKWLLIVFLVVVLPGGCQILLIGGASGDVFRYMLPFTLPARVTFVDETSQEQIKNVRVRFTWNGSRGNAGGYGGGWTYYDKEIVTNQKGSARLPVRLKPFPILFIPLYMSGHDAITVSMATWKYKPLKYLKDYDPYGDIVSIFGTEINPVIKVKRLNTSDEQLAELIRNSYIFGKSFWNEGFTEITKDGHLESISTNVLSLAGEACSKNSWQRCDVIDHELLKRNDGKGDVKWAEDAALRLGIVTPAMRKIVNDHRNKEQSTVSEDERITAIKAADPTVEQKLLSRFRTSEYQKMSATQLHAEGKRLFAAKKYDNATATWLIELEKDPQNANTMNNISIAFEYLGNYIKSEYWAVKAIKQAPEFGHAYISRGIALNRMGRYWQAVEELQKGIKLGYEDPSAHLNLIDAYYMMRNSSDMAREIKLTRSKFASFPNLDDRLKFYEDNLNSKP